MSDAERRNGLEGIPGKWVRDLEPEMPAIDAARQVLELRLKSVETLLPLAARHAHEDTEYVHQLRVATRRSGAALRAFRPCLRKKSARGMAKSLRTIRRAAGEARCLDVQIKAVQSLRKQFSGGARVLIEEFTDELGQRRVDANLALEQTLKHFPRKTLKGRRKAVMTSLHEPSPWLRQSCPDVPSGEGPMTLRQLGEVTVPSLVRSLQRAGSADLRLIETLHDLRLHGKRLRYALEIFRCCQGELFKPRYERLESFQEALGDINDAHELLVAMKRFVAGRTNRRREVFGEAVMDDVDARSAAGDVMTMTLRQRRDDGVRVFLDAWRAGAWKDLWTTVPSGGNGRSAGPPSVQSEVVT
ncbi:MAG: CHAD domain-containing protein [Phycisphaerales bacterium]|nr:CHAD domain-containing protein [Phycisphaerales bacterium]